ncbi:retrovirus-related Pol polyprotein from transposon 297 [Nephila pilipes]|uniref:Retrovirus-related Pol polyprotein from transposon 297 n=1 Tax=Nephila pilipes TaxID=299642 RepID=A0A8X6QF14_NEPPI|nr:retrovirus-related Pol polyprotein from transposon 297 [Nephila pilipes]
MLRSWFAAVAEGYKNGESKQSSGPINEEERKTIYAKEKNNRVTCPFFDRGSNVNSSAIRTVFMIMISCLLYTVKSILWIIFTFDVSHEDSEATINISCVSVKVPPFWRANPEILLSQMKKRLILAGITIEITKFHHVISALQSEELGIVGDIILNPPAEKPYKALRTRLCSQYVDSEKQRLRDLIYRMQLGDRKPSCLLLEMRNKAGNRMTEELLKSLFLQRLPTYVQQILAISNDQLEKLAEMADGIIPRRFMRLTLRTDIKTTLRDISSRLSTCERSTSRGPERRFCR